ncbi:hypothetical protein HA402_013329 [Bradysia odoriphaga]|nr:hypothetical protein HA402_013329 [Bradysia odoriphaga]
MSETPSYEIFDWINKAYLQKVLESHEAVAVNIINHDVKHATAKGDGNLSAMFRASIKYSTGADRNEKNISIIIKARLDDAALNEITEEYNLFERESQAYKCIIKDSMVLLREIGDDTVFAPRLIYIDDNAIIQEDLSAKGYAMKNCKKRLNLRECKMVLEKVAKYHACTAVLYQRNPEKFQYHKQSNVTENFNPLHLFYQNMLANCIKYAKTVPQLQCYIEKLEIFHKQVIEKMVDVFKRDDQSFNVLNHGDLWINNLMFHSDSNGEADEVLLIDYQEGFFGSPGIDLNWFTYTSCNQDVLTNDVQTLYQYYYTVLAETLKKLKYPKDIPSLADIQNEIQKKGNHGLTTLICYTPIFFNERKELQDAVNFISDSEECEQIRTIIVDNPDYAQILVDNFPKFVESGHF